MVPEWLTFAGDRVSYYVPPRSALRTLLKGYPSAGLPKDCISPLEIKVGQVGPGMEMEGCGVFINFL